MADSRAHADGALSTTKRARVVKQPASEIVWPAQPSAIPDKLLFESRDVLVKFIRGDPQLNCARSKNKLVVLPFILTPKLSVVATIALEPDDAARCDAQAQHEAAPSRFIINLTTGVGCYVCAHPSCAARPVWGRRIYALPGAAS